MTSVAATLKTRLRRLAATFSFRHISGQIAALVVVSLVIIHGILTAFWMAHSASERSRPERRREEIETLAHMIAAAPAPDRPRLIAEIDRAFPALEIAIAPEGLQPDPQQPPSRWLTPPVAAGLQMFVPLGSPNPGHIAVRLPDDFAIIANIGPPRTPPLFGILGFTLLFVVISITLLGVWAARALSSPLSAFAHAAENFGLDGNGDAAALPENGPEEIRAAATALNRMRRRITALMQDRMHMLAAISHDLRTPITRMRLRTEFIENDTQRRHMLHDLDQMRSMLDSVLSFLRNGDTGKPTTLVDVAAELHLICDQYGDLGHEVTFSGPTGVAIMARPEELHGAVSNLVGNAVRFGTTVEIVLRLDDGHVIIEVIDNGPGIDDARKAAMLEPFVRGDDSRNMNDDAGFGLGLSIAHTIVTSHGGSLSLLDRMPHGLIARIVLPLSAPRQAAA